MKNLDINKRPARDDISNSHLRFELRVNAQRLAKLVDYDPCVHPLDVIVDAVEQHIIAQDRRINKLERMLKRLEVIDKAVVDEAET